MRIDDNELIKKFKNIFNFGYTGYANLNHINKNPTIFWGTKNIKECVFITKIIDKYPLWSKKKKDYEIWKQAVFEKIKPFKQQDQLLLEYYYRKIKEVRLYKQPKIKIDKPIDKQLKLKVI